MRRYRGSANSGPKPEGWIDPTDLPGLTWGHWHDYQRDYTGNLRYTVQFTLFPYASGSDYSGNLMERSNARVIVEELGDSVVEVSGGYSTFGVGFLGTYEQPMAIDEETGDPVPMDDETAERIREICTSLEAYPCLDEDDHSELEQETMWEQWKDYGRSDFRRELESRLEEWDPWYDHDIDLLTDEDLDWYWWNGCDAYNVNGGSGYANEEGDSIHFYLDEWCDSAEAERNWDKQLGTHHADDRSGNTLHDLVEKTRTKQLALCPDEMDEETAVSCEVMLAKWTEFLYLSRLYGERKLAEAVITAWVRFFKQIQMERV